jgi:hypothetical protein
MASLANSSSTDACTSPPSNDNKSNNTGYIAGIAIMSVAFGITLIALIISLCYLRQLKQERGPVSTVYTNFEPASRYNSQPKKPTPVELETEWRERGGELSGSMPNNL